MTIEESPDGSLVRKGLPDAAKAMLRGCNNHCLKHGISFAQGSCCPECAATALREAVAKEPLKCPACGGFLERNTDTTSVYRCLNCGRVGTISALTKEAFPVCKEPIERALASQVGGDHYKKLKIQPMEYSMANNLNACQHTIIKYVTRYKDKGGIEDLKKARHTIDMLIELESKE